MAPGAWKVGSEQYSDTSFPGLPRLPGLLAKMLRFAIYMYIYMFTQNAPRPPQDGPGSKARPWPWALGPKLCQNLENPVLTHRPPNEFSRACPGSIFHFKMLVLPKFWAGFGPRAQARLGMTGWAKNEGMGKVKYGGWEFLRAPNGKPPPRIERYGPGDAKNLVFD